MAGYRVLVIGGYGFFGRRLVERLSRQPSLQVIVAGRSRPRAQALLDELGPRAEALLGCAVLDVDSAEFAAELLRLQPQAVVHTSGPFQGQDYHVAEACLAAGAHYIDLADGREFVAGIDVLDGAARARGLAVIAGASSVPALSSAAVDELAHGLARVDDIDIGISPGNRTDRGLATVRAILSYCGKALPGAGGRVFGWSGSRSHVYPAPVGRRWLSPCDVPDLALLPGRYAGRPLVRFGAGLELAFLHCGMNTMALLARFGLVADWSAHAGWLKRAADLFKSWGSDAGAMHVRVSGSDMQGRQHTRLWQLVATHGDGPFVPTLAAAALVRKLQQGGTLPSGARPCIGLLVLPDFARECEGLHIHMHPALSLYESVLGPRYAQLPVAVARFHRLSGRHRLAGRVRTAAPASFAARVLAACLGTPRGGSEGPIDFELDAQTEQECWTRHFPVGTMRSRMRLVGGRIQERLGAARLTFGLHVADGRLSMQLESMRFLGLPCPRWLMPRIVAEETGDADRLHFRVSARVPLVGTVAAYEGHLDLGPAEPGP